MLRSSKSPGCVAGPLHSLETTTHSAYAMQYCITPAFCITLTCCIHIHPTAAASAVDTTIVDSATTASHLAASTATAAHPVADQLDQSLATAADKAQAATAAAAGAVKEVVAAGVEAAPGVGQQLKEAAGEVVQATSGGCGWV